MNAFHVQDQLADLTNVGDLYREIVRSPSMSAGIYHLPAQSLDPQEPHTEDEIYYIISGKASIQVGDEHRPVETGSVVFVAAEVEHRFYAIIEDLTVLVVFAPAEHSNKHNREAP